MTPLSRRSARWLVALGAVLAAAGATYATAALTATTDAAVIHGCVLKKVGTLRVIDPAVQHCLAAETPIEWNETGPAATLRLDPLRGRLMVGRLTLDQEVGVRIPAPQL